MEIGSALDEADSDDSSPELSGSPEDEAEDDDWPPTQEVMVSEASPPRTAISLFERLEIINYLNRYLNYMTRAKPLKTMTNILNDNHNAL
jgi:hypothetical protein